MFWREIDGSEKDTAVCNIFIRILSCLIMFREIIARLDWEN